MGGDFAGTKRRPKHQSRSHHFIHGHHLEHGSHPHKSCPPCTMWGVPSFLIFCLFYFGSCGYQCGCTVAAVSAQRPVKHFKNALQNIANEGTPHSVSEQLTLILAIRQEIETSKVQHFNYPQSIISAYILSAYKNSPPERCIVAPCGKPYNSILPLLPRPLLKQMTSRSRSRGGH